MDAKNQIPASGPLPDQRRPGEPLLLVGFHVGAEEFGLDILRVQEIIRVQQLTRVPNSPRAVDGVMNLRGRIIPVIALRQRFGLQPASTGKNARIVVMDIQGTVLGLIVDSVSEVLRIPPETIEAPPRLSRSDREYVTGVGKLENRLVLLLDADRLIAGDEMPEVQQQR